MLSWKTLYSLSLKSYHTFFIINTLFLNIIYVPLFFFYFHIIATLFLIGSLGSRRSTNTVLRETDKVDISVLPSRMQFACDTRKSMFSHAHMPIGENLNQIDKNTQRGMFHKL